MTESGDATQSVTGTAAPGTGDVPGVVEHLFRHEAGRMVAILTRVFGVEHLGLVEDVVQEALARALQTWPFYGVPANPAAWILRASRNLALDVVRRERVFRDKEPELIRLLDAAPVSSGGAVPGTGEEGGWEDDRLRLMFVCCHPAIPAEAQVALALRTLCGFSPEEIGRAFLTSEAAIAKRLVRARQKIREARVPFEIPDGGDLGGRLEGVLRTLYLLFNEGYKASSGDALVRDELCREAIRLGTLLTGHPAGNRPQTHALLAMMYLNASRLPARVDAEGQLRRMLEQDRSRWDRGLIARGMYHLAQSASGPEATPYHIQAGIAACHCAAPDQASTNWPQILGLYDRLMELDPSPVVALNRAVAVAEVEGPAAGLAALAAIVDRDRLASYHLLPALEGEFEARCGRWTEAGVHYRRALELVGLESERAFLARRLGECERRASERPGG